MLERDCPPPAAWRLPPLILHPFADASGAGKLVESSRASLMLQGLLPWGKLSEEELERRLLEGRYYELRMLFYVGRDLMRWIEQCTEFAGTREELHARRLGFACFAQLLVETPPPAVVRKLEAWGVIDYKAIFRRAIGLNCVFGESPEWEQLSPAFILDYYQYADQLYRCRLNAEASKLSCDLQFDFELYASGEYARLLEEEWGQQEA